jgi:hypothetical protein
MTLPRHPRTSRPRTNKKIEKLEPPKNYSHIKLYGGEQLKISRGTSAAHGARLPSVMGKERPCKIDAQIISDTRSTFTSIRQLCICTVYRCICSHPPWLRAWPYSDWDLLILDYPPDFSWGVHELGFPRFRRPCGLLY